MENNTILKFDGLSKKFKEKNRSLDTLYQNCGSYLVEVRRIELLSEGLFPWLSTSVVCILKSLTSPPANRLWCLVVPTV